MARLKITYNTSEPADENVKATTLQKQKMLKDFYQSINESVQQYCSEKGSDYTLLQNTHIEKNVIGNMQRIRKFAENNITLYISQEIKINRENGIVRLINLFVNDTNENTINYKSTIIITGLSYSFRYKESELLTQIMNKIDLQKIKDEDARIKDNTSKFDINYAD
jgi:hypothetical protein